jgi:hypothetical protein
MNRRPSEANCRLVSMMKTRNNFFDVDRIVEYGLECFELQTLLASSTFQHKLWEELTEKQAGFKNQWKPVLYCMRFVICCQQHTNWRPRSSCQGNPCSSHFRSSSQFCSGHFSGRCSGRFSVHHSRRSCIRPSVRPSIRPTVWDICLLSLTHAMWLGLASL